MAGHKPMANLQRALINAIERFLHKRDIRLESAELILLGGFAEPHALFFEARAANYRASFES